MKKRKRLIAAICLVCVVFAGGLVCLLIHRSSNRSSQLYQAVQAHVQQHGESTVSLAQLTDFEWEEALYFYYTNPTAIYDAIGVRFAETDLTTGLLFVKNGEVVYHEFFPQKAGGISPRWGRGFDVYPAELTMQNVGQSLRIFQRDDVFEIGETKDKLGGKLFWMTAID